MKGIGSFIICFLAISTSLAQELKIKKEKIEGINTILDSTYYRFSRAFAPADHEAISPEIIDTTGRYIIDDVMDGESAGYTFYSRDGQKLNEYRPYPFFSQYYHDVSQLNVVVAASTDQSSSKLKVAWLNHHGELLNEKEVDKDDSFLRDIKVINNRLVVISHDVKHRFTITCYDKQLNTLWSKKIEEFIYYGGIKSITFNNSIIVFTKQGIKSFDLNKGEEIWIRRTDTFQPKAKSISINGELIFGKHYLGVISCETDLDKNGRLKKAFNINFHVYDIRNGHVVFRDKIEDAEDIPVVCKNLLDLDSNHVYIKSKDKSWRYSLVR